jgi:hypothetical protein
VLADRVVANRHRRFGDVFTNAMMVVSQHASPQAGDSYTV